MLSSMPDTSNRMGHTHTHTHRHVYTLIYLFLHFLSLNDFGMYVRLDKAYKQQRIHTENI